MYWSVQVSHSVMSNSLQPHGLQHARLPCPSPTQTCVHHFRSGLFETHGLQHSRLPCPSPTPRACSDSCPLSRWCHPTISYFSSRPQSFPASGSFPMSWFFALGGQSIGVSASALVLPMKDWSPLEWTGWISLQSKGLSGVFSSTITWKNLFFSAQLS